MRSIDLSPRRSAVADATFDMMAPIGILPLRPGLTPINIPRPSSSYDDRMFSFTDRDLLSSSLDISGPLSPLFAPASWTHALPVLPLGSGAPGRGLPSSCMSRTLSTRSSSSASSCSSSARSVRFSQDEPSVKLTWPKGIYDRAPIKVDALSKGLGMKRCKTSSDDARNEDDQTVDDNHHLRDFIPATATASPSLSPRISANILAQPKYPSSDHVVSLPIVPVISTETRRTLDWLAIAEAADGDHGSSSSSDDDDTDDGAAPFGFCAGTLYSEAHDSPVRPHQSHMTTSRPDLRHLSATSVPLLDVDQSILSSFDRSRLHSDSSTVDDLTFNDRSVSPVSLSPDVSPNNSSLFDDDTGLVIHSSPSKGNFEVSDVADGPRMISWGNDNGVFDTARKLRTVPQHMLNYPRTIANPIYHPARSESLKTQQQQFPQLSGSTFERRTALRAKFSLRARQDDHDCLGGF